jgi:hypothetical protein
LSWNHTFAAGLFRSHPSDLGKLRMMNLVEEFRRHAAECRRMARGTVNADSRQIGNAWPNGGCVAPNWRRINRGPSVAPRGVGRSRGRTTVRFLAPAGLFFPWSKVGTDRFRPGCRRTAATSIPTMRRPTAVQAAKPLAADVVPRNARTWHQRDSLLARHVVALRAPGTRSDRRH